MTRHGQRFDGSIQQSRGTHIDAGGIMAPSHVSVVVANSIQAIMAARLLALVRDVGWQIQIAGGEVNECLQLVSCELGVGEPFEVDHQNFGQPPEIQFLHRLLMLLAGRAIPDKQAQNKVGLNNETNSTLTVWNRSLGYHIWGDILRRYNVLGRYFECVMSLMLAVLAQQWFRFRKEDCKEGYSANS